MQSAAPSGRRGSANPCRISDLGLTAAANYAVSGLIDWAVAAEFIARGALAGLLGVHLATRLAARRRLLSTVFAGVVFVVAVYVAVRTLIELHS